MIGKDRNHEFYIVAIIYGLVAAALIPVYEKYNIHAVFAYITPIILLFLFSEIMNFFDKK